MVFLVGFFLNVSGGMFKIVMNNTFKISLVINTERLKGKTEESLIPKRHSYREQKSVLRRIDTILVPA